MQAAAILAARRRSIPVSGLREPGFDESVEMGAGSSLEHDSFGERAVKDAVARGGGDLFVGWHAVRSF